MPGSINCYHLQDVFKVCKKLFAALPLAAVIAERTLVLHGGKTARDLVQHCTELQMCCSMTVHQTLLLSLQCVAQHLCVLLVESA